MAMLQQAGSLEIMRAAVRIALTVKLSDEASNAGEPTGNHSVSTQELLASLTSGSADDDSESADDDAQGLDSSD
jgi:hypothetical protein